MAAAQRWWGKYDIQPGEQLHWQIGPASVWLARDAGEWRYTRTSDEDPMASGLVVADRMAAPSEDDADVVRFAASNNVVRVRVLPALADRPMVVKTHKPFHVPAGEEVRMFVSLPLWLQVIAGGQTTPLIDEPFARPSDTWFGPDTQRGELCYASRTSARLNLDNLPDRPHRAITVTRIRNQATSTLPIEKLKIPVENLSLFATPDGRLWTESLTFVREEDSGNATVQLDKRPKQPNAELVAKPRTPITRGFLLEAFGNLFTRRGAKTDERLPGKPGTVTDIDA